jgi:hypothetical protein
MHPVTLRNLLEKEDCLNVDLAYRTVNQISCHELRNKNPALFWNLIWHF